MPGPTQTHSRAIWFDPVSLTGPPARGRRYFIVVASPEVPIAAAAVELPCGELEPELAFFVDALGFRVESIHPAHAPHTCTLRGHGLRVHLRAGRGQVREPLTLRLHSSAQPLPETQTSPAGTRVEWHPLESPLVAPPNVPRLVIQRANEGEAGAGRAGMIYRDLLPGSHGGAFIASHIGIPEGGPVPDYVHYHRVEAQLIYCQRGWVKVVYEDQGEPFVMHAGDCVLQPPTIRHRVLEASAGLEVVELSSPAEHETRGDLELELPNGVELGKRYGGQAFHRHVAASASWVSVEGSVGVDARDLGLAEPSGDRIRARVLRGTAGARLPAEDEWMVVERELALCFVTCGQLRVHIRSEAEAVHVEALAEGDCITLPPGAAYRFEWIGPDTRVLDIQIERS